MSSSLSLPPEVESGCVEYKFSLCSKLSNSSRLCSLISQMKWRMTEGNGVCYYELGVLDNGLMCGLSCAELNESMRTLEYMAESISCECELVRISEGIQGKCAQIRVKKKLFSSSAASSSSSSSSSSCHPCRIALVGRLHTGKSSLLGVLYSKHWDNGRGSARCHVVQHRHEMEEGKTSSITKSIFSKNEAGVIAPIFSNSIPSFTASEEDEQEQQRTEQNNNTTDTTQTHTAAAAASTTNVLTSTLESSFKRIFVFYDLGGSETYLKTSIRGLVGSVLDYTFVCISAAQGVDKLTKELLILSIALSIPIVILLTKIDLIDEVKLNELIQEIQKLLKNKQIQHIINEKNLMETIDLFKETINNPSTASSSSTTSSASLSLVPLLCLSNVTGVGIDLFQLFLRNLPLPNHWEQKTSSPVQFSVDCIYDVDEVGLVIGGILQSGVMSINQTLMIGPINRGYSSSSAASTGLLSASSSSPPSIPRACFLPVVISSIHVNRHPVTQAHAGQSCSITFKQKSLSSASLMLDRSHLRVGIQLLCPSLSPRVSIGFDCFVQLFPLSSPSSSLDINYEPVVVVGNTQQSVRLISSSPSPIVSGCSSAEIKFYFVHHGEYLQKNQKIILREGNIKGIGIIKEIHLQEEEEEENATQQKQLEERGGTGNVHVNAPTSPAPLENVLLTPLHVASHRVVGSLSSPSPVSLSPVLSSSSSMNALEETFKNTEITEKSIKI